MSPAAKQMMDLQRLDPNMYRRLIAQKAVRNWMRNLRAAQEGKGFFKIDHCEAMLSMQVARYKETFHVENEKRSRKTD